MRHWKAAAAAGLLLLSACGTPAERPREEAAWAAYERLLAGDASLLADRVIAWEWEEVLYPAGDLEYTLLDLDGGGVSELAVQRLEDPNTLNAVFHYEAGRIDCWACDAVEMCGWSYPLQDGTMVSQYDYGGSSTYTLFRYQADGSQEEAPPASPGVKGGLVPALYVRQEPAQDGDTRPCPYYEVDGEAVSRAAFQAALEERVTSRLLDRSAWTAVEPS